MKYDRGNICLHYYIIFPISVKRANSADPDQTPQIAASDRGLHCMHEIQEFLKSMLIIKLIIHPAVGNRPVQRVMGKVHSL